MKSSDALNEFGNLAKHCGGKANRNIHGQRPKPRATRAHTALKSSSFILISQLGDLMSERLLRLLDGIVRSGEAGRG